MTTTSLIALILTLILKIWDAYKESKDEAEAQNKKYEIDQNKFLAIADSAIAKMRDEVKKENDSAGDVEDQINREIKS